MTHFRGEGASRGIAIGPAHVAAAKITVAERRILRQDRAAEVAHLEEGLGAADEQLDSLQRQLADRKGAGADLVQAHRLMLRSPEVAGEARRLILEECFAAEWAVSRALDEIRATFLRIQDPYFRARGGDFEAVGERLIRALLGLPELRAGAEMPKGSIAIGTDMAPFDPFHLQAAGVLGSVTEHGGKTSHAAIVARALELPYVVGVKDLVGRVLPGALVVVDGGRGDVVIDPSPEVLSTYRARADAQRRRVTQLLAEKDLPAVTTDGVGIHLRANVESLLGVASVAASGAEGIGLFRTEFLYLERTDLPTEEEQYRDALSVLNAVGGLPVTFRTLDLGGDKLPSAFRMPEGANPALGVRSIRFSLERPDIFRTQLRALYRASAAGTVRVMLPLITGVDELRRALAICAGVRADLAAEGLAYDPRLPLGIMLETPSAAVTTDLLAREVDFFSIGTNDLIQYAFAADRENGDVAHLQHPLQPAVLRLVKQMIDAAALAQVPISICGDMASDPSLTWLLLGLGLRDLSMDPHSIPMVKAIIRRSSLADAQALATAALKSGSEQETTRLIREAMGSQFAADLEAFLPAADA
ncbi:MAG: phosphoenolpyruvate--protein phosphotransferase [Polyangia bacterium]|jgi:phosphoenolpyruvate-protein phosphotransferase (PTS system enzyme I)